MFNESFQDVKAVSKRIGLATSTVWAKAKKGQLPKPIKISNGYTRWKSSEIDEYLADPCGWIARNQEGN